MFPSSHTPRTRLATGDGFVLIEMIVALIAAMMVAAVAFLMIQVSMGQAARVTASANATRQGRSALEKVMSVLHNSCVAPRVEPVSAGSDGTKLVPGHRQQTRPGMGILEDRHDHDARERHRPGGRHPGVPILRPRVGLGPAGLAPRNAAFERGGGRNGGRRSHVHDAAFRERQREQRSHLRPIGHRAAALRSVGVGRSGPVRVSAQLSL